ncbi:MAG: hypothetical protein C0467_25150 [Planctomycetaceae bacterium]|nr:hypothetical protein [Planctomycetaceae bacterium]
MIRSFLATTLLAVVAMSVHAHFVFVMWLRHTKAKAGEHDASSTRRFATAPRSSSTRRERGSDLHG